MATTTLTPAASTYRTGLYAWLTTTDHKKIGILYVVNSFVFAGGVTLLSVAGSLVMAALATQKIRGLSAYRTLLLWP